ncbi:MAG: hypothetical protein ACRDYY_00445 [Acidimicrobiales bacterium]
MALLDSSEDALAASYRQVAAGHQADADVHYACRTFAGQCDAHRERLAPILGRYDREGHVEPERLRPDGLTATRSGAVGLLRDLQDLYQLANLVEITWTAVGQAAAGARDRALLELTARGDRDTEAQLAWLCTRIKAEAPQALLAAP